MRSPATVDAAAVTTTSAFSPFFLARARDTEKVVSALGAPVWQTNTAAPSFMSLAMTAQFIILFTPFHRRHLRTIRCKAVWKHARIDQLHV